MKRYYYLSILPSATYGIYILRIIKKCGIFKRKYKFLDVPYPINPDIINNDDIINSKENIITRIMLHLSDIIKNKENRKEWKYYFPSHYLSKEMEENLTMVDYKNMDCISSSISIKTIHSILMHYDRFKNCNIVDLNAIDKYTMLVDPTVHHLQSGEIIDTRIYAFNGTRYAKIHKKNDTILRHNNADINKYVEKQIEDHVVLQPCNKIDYAIIYGNAYFIK